MKTIKMMVAAAFLFAVAFSAEAAERRIYPCHRLTQAPVVDGRGDDEAWKNIPEATAFYKQGLPERYVVAKQTAFKAGWMDDALYLLIRAEEPNPERMIATQKDEGEVWIDDGFEIFVVPAGVSDYTQLVVNNLGYRYNGRGSAGLKVKDWQAKAVVGKDAWVLELRIPYDVLSAKMPKEGEVWPVNVGRNIRTGPPDEMCTSWPLLPSGCFNEVKSYGSFVFEGVAGKNVREEERKMVEPYIRSLQAEIKKWAGMAGKYEKDLVAAQKSESQRAEAENLLRIWEQAVKMAAKAEPDCREMRSVSLACVGLRQKSEDCIARGMLDLLFKK